MWFALSKNEWKQLVVVHSIDSDIGMLRHRFGSDTGMAHTLVCSDIGMARTLECSDMGLAPTLVWPRHWYGSYIGMALTLV